MTIEEFQARYRLLKEVASDGVRTYHAIAPTGAVVMVHIMDGLDAGEASALLTRLPALDAEERRRVLEVLEVDGHTVVVTKFIIEFESFRKWLLGPSGGAGEAPDTLPPSVPGASPAEAPVRDPGALPASSSAATHETGDDGPGEFTRLFKLPAAGTAPAPEIGDALPAETGAAEPISADSGSGAPALPPGSAGAGGRTDASVDGGAAGGAPVEEPGEFTRLFLAQSTPAPPQAGSPEEPAEACAGAPPDPGPPLIRWVDAGAESGGEASTSRPASDGSAPAPGGGGGEGEGPGEFTRLFAAVRPPEPAPATDVPAPPPAAGPTSPTAPMAPAEPGSAPPAEPIVRWRDDTLREEPSAAPPPPAAGAGESMGEFTLLFGKVDPASPAHGLPGPAPAPPPRDDRPLFGAEPGGGPAAGPGAGSTGGVFGAAADEDYLDRLSATTPPAPRPAPMPVPAPSTPPQPILPGIDPLPPAPPPAAGPSEYTRVIGAAAPPPTPMPTPAPSTPPDPAAQAPQAPAEMPIVPIVIGLIVVVLAAVAIVVVFALRGG